jgi:hypothetical protein
MYVPAYMKATLHYKSTSHFSIARCRQEGQRWRSYIRYDQHQRKARGVMMCLPRLCDLCQVVNNARWPVYRITGGMPIKVISTNPGSVCVSCCVVNWLNGFFSTYVKIMYTKKYTTTQLWLQKLDILALPLMSTMLDWQVPTWRVHQSYISKALAIFPAKEVIRLTVENEFFLHTSMQSWCQMFAYQLVAGRTQLCK